MPEITKVETIAQSIEVLNTDVSAEKEASKHDFANNELQACFDNHRKQAANLAQDV